ncbi:MAG: flagellar biosynthesis anti-sigma factor FlgM [Thermacetogeniaceae bacterium]
MIISNQEIQMVLRQYGVQKTKNIEEKRQAESTKAAQKGTDKAEFSGDAALLQKAREIAKELPDVREDRVRKIKAAIERGEYKVSAEDVAEKMLGRWLVDDLI